LELGREDIVKDPTRDELIAYLESVYPEVTCGETLHSEQDSERDDHDGCPCRFDIEEAAYYLAAHYHSGQWSNLYSALCRSQLRPGPSVSDLPDDEERPTASDLYRAGAAWIEGH
jgi:hypothetical protein